MHGDQNLQRSDYIRIGVWLYACILQMQFAHVLSFLLKARTDCMLRSVLLDSSCRGEHFVIYVLTSTHMIHVFANSEGAI